MTASLREIKVYTTFPHRCSYLEGEEATTLFVDPRQKLSPELYTQLSLLGFRRSGDHVYRPHCARCNACIASRVRVQEFQASRTQQRISKRNSDLRIEQSDSILDDEAYNLYRYYIETRHADGDMYPPEREQYESFLNDGLGCAIYYRLYAGNRLVAVTVADKMLDGLAAIYSFLTLTSPAAASAPRRFCYKFARHSVCLYPSSIWGIGSTAVGRWPISPDLLRLSFCRRAVATTQDNAKQRA